MSVGGLIVRLICQSEAFQAEMQKAVREIRGVRSEIKETQKVLKDYTRSAVEMAAGYIGWRKAVDAIKSVTKAAMDQQEAEMGLAAALNVTDKLRAKALGTFKQFAAGMQEQTVFSEQEVLSQIAYAKNLGITTDRLQDAVKAAAGWKAALRLESLESAMLMIGKAAEGNVTAFKKRGFAIDESLSKEEKFHAVLQGGIERFRLAQEETKTAAGAIKQLGNAWEQAKEQMGMGLLEGMTIGAKDLNVELKKNQQNFLELGKMAGVALNRAAAGLVALKNAHWGTFPVINAIRDVNARATRINAITGAAPYPGGGPVLSDAEIKALGDAERAAKAYEERQIAVNKVVDEYQKKIDSINADNYVKEIEKIKDITAEESARIREAIGNYELYRFNVELTKKAEDTRRKAAGLGLEGAAKEMEELRYNLDKLTANADAQGAAKKYWEQNAEAVREYMAALGELEQKELEVKRAKLSGEIGEKFATLEEEKALLAMRGEANVRREWARDIVDLQKKAVELYGAESEAAKKVVSDYISLRGQVEDMAQFFEMGEQLSRSMTDNIIDGIMQAKSWGDVMRSILNDIQRMMLQAAFEPMRRQAAAGMGGFFAGMFGGGGGTQYVSTGEGVYAASAKGNVFDRGRITAFASGGIFDSPTVFPMAGGRRGMMGEDGPEAVMPLVRGAGGRLGVEAVAGKQSITIPPTVIINNNSGTPLKRGAPPKFDGKNWVVNIVAENIDNYGILYHKMQGS